MPPSQLYAGIEPSQLVGVARAAVAASQDSQALARWLPNTFVSGVQYKYPKQATRVDTAASPRALDTEANLQGRRVKSGNVIGEMPAWGEKMKVGERDIILEDDFGDEIAGQAFADAAQLAKSIAIGINLQRGESLETGKIVLDVDVDGVHLDETVNWGRDASLTKTAATAWTDPAAPIIADIIAMSDDWLAVGNPSKPDYMLMAQSTINLMLKNTEIRDSAGVLAPRMSIEALNGLLSDYGLPQLVPNDEQYLLDEGPNVFRRVISEAAVLFLPAEPVGNTLYGTTAEAKKLNIIGSEAPGIVATATEQWDPVGVWTKASARAMPIVTNPNATGVITTR